MGQRYAGHPAITAAWKPIYDDATSRFTVEDSFTAGDHLAQRGRYDWDDGHMRGIDVLTVQNGKVTKKIAYEKAKGPHRHPGPAPDQRPMPPVG